MASVIILSNFGKGLTELIAISCSCPSKAIKELKSHLSKIDGIIGALDAFVKQNNYGLFISSLYGIETQMYNSKQELVKINFSGRAPVLVDDNDINASSHTLVEGSLFDLCNSILSNINPEYKVPGLLRKKAGIFSIFYKKPKEVKNNEQANV